MADTKTAGFTIIEVVLFLALSALFLMIAFMGVRGRSQAVQFTDSMRSLSNYLNRQYNDTLNGVNSRGSLSCAYGGSGFLPSASATSPGRSGCTIMGRAVVFNNNSRRADVYHVVGRFLTQTVPASDPNYLDPTDSDLVLIQQAQPVVLRDRLATFYDIEWNTTFQASGSDNTALAFIRSPRSSAIYPLVFTPSWGSNMTPPLNVTTLTADGDFCFLGINEQDAEIQIGGTNQADAIDTVFDTGCI